MFKALGLGVAGYAVYALLRGEVYAKDGAGGRRYERAVEPRAYWGAIGAYAALSIALLFLF